MSHPATDPTLGPYLQSLRERAGLDVAALARRVSLSPAQLSQLEQGQDTLFYNRKIREQAARKVIMHLGGDPARVGGNESEPEASQAPAPATPTAAPMVSAQLPIAAQRRPALRFLMWGLVLSGLMFIAAYVAGSRPAADSTPVPAASRVVERPVSDNPGLPASRAEPVATEPPAALAPQETPPTAPSVAVVEPARDKVAETSPAVSCPEAAAGPAIRPPQAYKAGDMVHVVSLGPAWVCLIDGSGKLSSKRLEAGQAQSFYGPPPWVVRSEQLRQTQLYFQGWKVRLPEQAQDSIQLVELR